MIHTFRQNTHTLLPNSDGSYFVISRERGHSIGKVIKTGRQSWVAMYRDTTKIGSWRQTGANSYRTRTAAAAECVRAHFGYPSTAPIN